MELDKLLLRKEELPINETWFYVPIHPRLLDPTISLNPELAREVFPQVAQEWYEDLSEYAESVEDPQTRDWIKQAFLERRPKIKSEYGRNVLDTIYWEDDITPDDNGFVRGLSISRNFGGSLYFNKGDMSCERFIFYEGNERIARFSKGKFKEFGAEGIHQDPEDRGVMMHVYAQHNVDHYPGALFLRNWAIAYENEALKSLFSG